MVSYQTITYDVKDRIATVTLNRPERLNAINEQMGLDLISAIEAAQNDEDIRVFIITGAGRAFCSGADWTGDDSSLRLIGSQSAEMFQRRLRPIVPKLIIGLQNLHVPTIAMINGDTVGLGFDMAMSCDIKTVAENARMACIWVKRGLIPASGSLWMLPRLVGVARASDIIFSGRFVMADEAEKIGLVNLAAPLADLKEETLKLAQSYVDNPPIGIKLAKMVMYKGLAMDISAALEMSIANQSIAFATEDHKEAIDAWREKREPIWKGK